jgi:hypothetical protein
MSNVCIPLYRHFSFSEMRLTVFHLLSNMLVQLVNLEMKLANMILILMKIFLRMESILSTSRKFI